MLGPDVGTPSGRWLVKVGQVGQVCQHYGVDRQVVQDYCDGPDYEEFRGYRGVRCHEDTVQCKLQAQPQPRPTCVSASAISDTG